MESVPPAMIVMFVILAAAMTLVGGLVDAQTTLHSAWVAASEHQLARAAVGLTVVRGQITDGGNTLAITVRNTGSARLADFKQWDAIIQYTDSANALNLRWLPYQPTGGLNTWQVGGLYLDAAHSVAESHEPGIFNPGEEAIFRLSLSPSVAPHAATYLSLNTPEGGMLIAQTTRNDPPILAVNMPLTVTVGGTQAITAAMLNAPDPDQSAAEVTFTVIEAPKHGLINVGRSFTQAAIAAELVTYTHDSGPERLDSFAFTVSDGEHVIGVYQFVVNIEE